MYQQPKLEKKGIGFLGLFRKTPDGIKKMQKIAHRWDLSEKEKIQELKKISKEKLDHLGFFRDKTTKQFYELVNKLQPENMAKEINEIDAIIQKINK